MAVDIPSVSESEFADAVAEALAVLRPALPRPRRRPASTTPETEAATEASSAEASPSTVSATARAGGNITNGEPESTATAGLQLGTLWTPPAAAADGHTPRQWEDSLRILDVLQLVRETGPGVPTETVATTAGITAPAAGELLHWLAETSLTRRLPDGTWEPGPLLRRIDHGENVLQPVLDQLMQDTGAAVYVSTYTDGEVVVPHSASCSTVPEVTVTADFRESAHASAVGKALQLAIVC